MEVEEFKGKLKKLEETCNLIIGRMYQGGGLMLVGQTWAVESCQGVVG